MSVFTLYFKLGISHIADLQGYDHILFLLVLCAVYTFTQWKQVLILITAFTLGHCTTLVLATLNIIRVSGDWIEFLIPVTIFITAVVNIIQKKEFVSPALHLAKYTTALFFGLIHGLGFSNYLRSLLGTESNLVKPLFAFNLGIELGQIVIVTLIFILTFVVVHLMFLKRRDWNLVLSGAGLGIALILMVERFPL